MRRIVIPLIFGLAGVAVLISLGTWQLQRLAWKQAILADIETHIMAAPVDLPAVIDPERDRYLPVTVMGDIAEPTLRVLVSQKQIGAGYLLINAMQIGERRVMVDRGFLSVNDPQPEAQYSGVQVTGNLHWPDDRTSSTPQNDVAKNIWFARDLAQMAQVLGTEPVLITAREVSFAEAGVTPLAVDTSSIPNDHLNYAITWFSLAAIWAAMTGYFLWRGRSVSKGK